MTWAVLFDDQPLRKDEQMEKSAGVFMRPSDIADHTNLAGALEGMLSQQPSREFRHEPGEMKFAGAAEMAVGGLAGAIAVGKKVYDVSRSSPVEPPQDVQGVRGHVARAKHNAGNWVRENPKTAIALGATVGGVAGATAMRSKNTSRRIKNILRTP